MRIPKMVVIPVIAFLVGGGIGMLVPHETSGIHGYYGQTVEYPGDSSMYASFPETIVERYRNALGDFAIALKQHPQDYEIWTQLGTLKYAFNNFTGARDAWEYAVKLNPKFSPAYYNLGNVYSAHLKNYKKAEASYRKAIEIDPKSFAQYYTALADFYDGFYIEKRAETERVLLAGIAAIPEDTGLLTQLAGFYKRAGRVAEARRYYEEALKIDPTLSGVRRDLEAL